MNANTKYINRIYVLEDDYELSDILYEGLTTLGYTVFVNNGNYINFNDIINFEPDLLIVDWMLPSIEGVDLIKRIKLFEKTMSIPCVLMTGRTTEMDKIIGFEVGVDAYLTKPFSFEMIKAVVANLEFRISVQEKYSISKGNFKVNSENEDFIAKFFKIIEENYNNPDLFLDTIASKLNTTKQSLITRVKMVTGKTPYLLLKEYRMERAKELILNGNRYLSKVAIDVGYRNLTVFSKVFKKHFHKSPRAFVNEVS